MSMVRSRTCVSLDGFSAAPDQSLENPFGVGGMVLPQWQFEADRPGREADARELARSTDNVGAFVMGRHMFGPGRGDWDLDWTGWWGPEPPYHAPVFVLTHHERESLPMEGGTTFHFVTDGVDAAMARAKEAAGERDVVVAGGAETLRQCLAAGYVDELTLHVVPVLLGAGERPLGDLAGLRLEQVEVVASPTVTHLRYRVG